MADDEPYTIVQHSGFGYAGKPQFAKGVEAIKLTGSRERRAVEAAGGLLFETYEAAEDYVQKISYPEGYTGIIPLAPGQFSAVKIQGLAVYVPVPAVV